MYRVIKDGDKYGVDFSMSPGGDGAIVYESMFTAVQAFRIVKCLNQNDALTWEDIADYVEGRTDVMPKVAQ